MSTLRYCGGLTGEFGDFGFVILNASNIMSVPMTMPEMFEAF